MGEFGSHAVVIGGSVGGLLAARALLGPYTTVTVLDRDELPTDGSARKGVPQGRHLHVLLARGQRIMDSMFPGILDELEADGVPVIRNWTESWVRLGGHLFTRTPRPLDPLVYQPSRPLLESRLRARLAALPGVSVLERHEVTGLLATPGGERVTGVRIHHDGVDSERSADLVVDATGRSGRAPVWLRSLGYEAPVEDQLPVDLLYASRRLRMPADALGGRRAVLIGPTPGTMRAMAMELMEGGQWVLTLAGYGENHPPTDEAGYAAFAASVLPPDMLPTVLAAEPLGPIVTHRFPANLRRRYERLERFPAGFLVFGDALCSFNPLYGQGISVAAMQAEALRSCLRTGSHDGRDLGPRFFRAAAKPVDVAWQFAIGADLSLPEIAGDRSLQTRLLNAYVGRVQAAAEHDTRVAEVFWRVMSFVSPPARLVAPDMAWRVLRRCR